jgi:tetratricopeptide (TPR) repeat protein
MSAAISLITLFNLAPWVLGGGERALYKQPVINVLGAYGYYLEKSFWPLDLSTHMELWKGSPVLQDALVGVLLLIVGTSIAVYASRHHRLVLVGWLWFLITLFPVSGVFSPDGHEWVANRFSYLSHIGLFVSVTILFSEFVRTRPKFFVTGNALVVISLAALAWGASAQLPHWRNTELLWERAINVTGGGPITHFNFGNYLLLMKRPEDALTHYEEANRLAGVHGYLVPSALQGSAYTALLLDDIDTELAKKRTATLLELGFDKNTLGRSTALGLVLRASGEHALAKEVFSQLLKHYEKRELDWSTRARLGLIASNIDLGQAKKADQQLGVYMSTMPRFQSEVCAMFEGGNRAAAGKQDLALFLFVLNSEPLRGTLIDYCG